MKNDPHFGHALTGIAERDIDLLLLEEFQTSELFVNWFCGEIGMTDVFPDGSWRSVVNSYGETDLLLRVRKDDTRIGLLIENKISAVEQDLQAERYFIRGTGLVNTGILDSFVTIICAPQIYLSGLEDKSVYNHRLAYEQIALWFGGQIGQRNSWRQYVMNQAIGQAKRGYKMIVDPLITEFQRAYWGHLKQNHPFLKMAEPKQRGGNSFWIILKGIDFPKGVQISHKFNSRTVELGFMERRIEDIMEKGMDWQSDGIRVSQNGRTESLVVDVAYIDMRSPFEPQLHNVDKAMQAAERLLPYATLLDKSTRVANAAGQSSGTKIFESSLNQSSLSDRERLEAIQRFLPIFTSSSFVFGELAAAKEGHFPYYTMSQPASEFYKAAYDAGWVAIFDWQTWSTTERYKELRDNHVAVAEAGVEDIVKLLTTIIRADRFVEGTLIEAFNSGLLLAIVSRTDALLNATALAPDAAAR